MTCYFFPLFYWTCCRVRLTWFLACFFFYFIRHATWYVWYGMSDISGSGKCPTRIRHFHLVCRCFLDSSVGEDLDKFEFQIQVWNKTQFSSLFGCAVVLGAIGWWLHSVMDDITTCNLSYRLLLWIFSKQLYHWVVNEELDIYICNPSM